MPHVRQIALRHNHRIRNAVYRVDGHRSDVNGILFWYRVAVATSLRERLAVPWVRLARTERDGRVLHIVSHHRQVEADHAIAARLRAQRVAHCRVRAERASVPHVRQIALRHNHRIRNAVYRVDGHRSDVNGILFWYRVAVATSLRERLAVPWVRLARTERDGRVLHIVSHHRQVEADHAIAARLRAQRVAHRRVRAERAPVPQVRQIALRHYGRFLNIVHRVDRQMHCHHRVGPVLGVQCNRLLPCYRKQAIVPDQRQRPLADNRIQLRYRRIGPHLKMESDDAVAACHIGNGIRLCSCFREVHAQRVVWQQVLHYGIIQITVCVIFDRHIYQYQTIATRRIGNNRIGHYGFCKGLSIQNQRQIVFTDLSIQYTISTFSYCKPQHFRRIAPLSRLAMPFVPARLPIYGIVPLIPVAGILCNHHRCVMIYRQMQRHHAVAAPDS